MPRGEYGNVALKQQLLARVDQFVAANTEGYTNRSEVIHAAIREFLDRRERPMVPPDVLERAVEEYLIRLRRKDEDRARTAEQ